VIAGTYLIDFSLDHKLASTPAHNNMEIHLCLALSMSFSCISGWWYLVYADVFFYSISAEIVYLKFIFHWMLLAD
jgi:hypothetical protein